MLNNKTVGQRISSLRKARGYTQEQLAKVLHVTGQAVSKWEKGHALPDTNLLPALARALNSSIDQLLTGEDLAFKASPYDELYAKQEFYWGLKHSQLAEMVVNLITQSSNKPNKHYSLLEIGSGEGRDAIYFAKCGFEVDALEISLPGIKKIKQYSESEGVTVNVIHADMINYQIIKQYDVIYSMRSLQFLPLDLRRQHFASYKQHTRPGGINAHLVFVEKPFIKVAPHWGDKEFFYRSGDLAAYYYDWRILHCEESIIDCISGNTPHQHAVSSIIAKKI